MSGDRAPYEIRVKGLLGPPLLHALPHVVAWREVRHTSVLATASDEADLVHVLRLLMGPGAELVSVRALEAGHEDPAA